MFGRADLERFLCLMPELRRLELVMNSSVEQDYFDANRWEIFVLQQLPRLLKFDFHFSSPHIDEQILDPYRASFWLDRHWYVAYDPHRSHLFTVPHFLPTSNDHASPPISANCTTLPLHQHQLFYDRVTEFTLKSDRLSSPFRYHQIQQLSVDCPLTLLNRFDLSSVRSLRVNISYWPLHEMLSFVQQTMPSLRSLILNCSCADLSDQPLPKISLTQVRTLSLPQYGHLKGKDSFQWSTVFPHVERLVVSINSKRQLAGLLEHFKTMVSAFFFLEPRYIAPKKQIEVTRQWLEKHLSRSQERSAKNFTYEMNNLYSFSLSLWIGDLQAATMFPVESSYELRQNLFVSWK